LKELINKEPPSTLASADDERAIPPDAVAV
jgi:hypothetical protein